ncbi:hypothetical protein SLEP1_g20419 [Rubroshorea leprosula]|uniref:Uncharacterized protein n=1 Tax=Rubroshorea leprosula TaxID=152421 RepID=A0AAV5JD71_9ROSI|nr:hypothetical protein SLEP1_g20419 [Rubroshorea leprosula]
MIDQEGEELKNCLSVYAYSGQVICPIADKLPSPQITLFPYVRIHMQMEK